MLSYLKTTMSLWSWCYAPAAAVSFRHILQAVAVLFQVDAGLNEFRVYSVDIMILSFDIYAANI